MQTRSAGGDQFTDANQSRDNLNDQFANQNQNNGNDQFNNMMPNKGNNFTPINQNRGSGEQFNQNRGGNQFGPAGNQNRPGANQNRNANNQNQSSGGGGGMNSGGGSRPRGTRGGKNRNKNRDNSGGNNFRDRSPINRGNRLDDKGGRDWDHKQGDRSRVNNFGRDSFNESNNRYEDFKNSGTRDMSMSFK